MRRGVTAVLGRLVDTSFLIDLVAALVQDCAIDPKWLLTGEYDGAAHRRALLLGEDRSIRGTRVMREFVYDEYRQLRHAKSFLSRRYLNLTNTPLRSSLCMESRDRLPNGERWAKP